MTETEKQTDGGLLSHGREINYLRVSVTDRCNMRCVYCMPEDVEFLRCEDILRYEELSRIIRVVTERAGITKVRLTGGEPLARKGIENLVAQLKRLEGIKDLSLTTNGLALAEKAVALKEAGLMRVNVSLDTLDSAKFGEICRAGRLDSVIAGIRAASKARLAPVKVNVVVMRGRNENEIEDFIDFAVAENVTVRFIEYMPIKQGGEWRELYVPREEIIESANGRLGEMESEEEDPHAPARYYPILGAGLKAGMISPVSHGFCSRCNRLRLTPEGRLLSCLLSPNSVDIRAIVRGGGSDDAILSAFKESVAMKGRKGAFHENGRPMFTVGG